MIKRRTWLLDLTMFLVFENQTSIKFTQKRNYRNTAFYYSSFVNQANWIFWAKHSAINPNLLFDVMGYTHSTNIMTITQNIVGGGLITTYNLGLLKNSQNVVLVATQESKKDAISAVYPGSSFYEREVQEMFGLRLRNLKDSRNLLLEYGNTTTPLIKESCVWGLEELVYSKKTEKLCWLGNSIFTL